MAGGNWKKGRYRKSWHGIPTALLLATSGLAGCGQEAAQDAQSFQVRDSAGVTIYDNSAGEWTEATAWTLSSEPILTIGELDGPEEYLFFRASGARRLSNGNIVVANRGTNELRFYDPNGTYVRTVGREGDGPGEFRSMGEPWLLGSDSIVISDVLYQRLTVFDINGQLGRSFQLDPMPAARGATARGILADASLLVSATIRFQGQRPQGMYRDTVLYARYSLEGTQQTTGIRRPGIAWYVGSLDGGTSLTGLVGTAPNPTFKVFGDRWYYGTAQSWEIEAYSPDGALTHLFRRNEANRPFTQEMEDEDRETLSPAEARFRLLIPIPETLPAYRSFMIGDDGSLWVENYTRSGEQSSWAVFRDDGRYLGDVDTPMGAQVTHIGDDFVLVIWEDELEVQRVQMYELIKP